MTKMNRILIGLLLAQIVLILGMGLAKEDTATTRVMKVFDNFDPAKVTHIKITSEPKDPSDANQPPQQSVELAKEGTAWGISTADNYPADGTKVQEMLEKLSKLKARGEVLKKATFHKKLEVAEDKYQRKVTLTHDGKTIEFFLGTSPSFKNVHFRRAGSDEVLQVGELTTWEVGARAWDWVNRTYVSFPEKDVWGVNLLNKNGRITMNRDAYGTWHVEGASGELKKTVIDDIVRKASAINIEEPVGKTEKPEYGLADPTATITLTTGTSTISGKMPEEMKTEVIRLGAKIEKENRYYAKATTSQYVVTVAGWAVDNLVTKTTKDLLEDSKKEEKRIEEGKKNDPRKTGKKLKP
jgi:uncharacterized protein DUF4340